MVAPHFLQLDAAKRAARNAARAARLGNPLAAGRALADHVLAAGLVPPGACVAGIWPLPGEVDLRPLMDALLARGHALALPFTPARGLPLEFRAWALGDALADGPMGTRYPSHGVVVVPDVVLVPLLAFDRAGGRLGYGGGYYDRTLAGLPDAHAIGVAFASQEMPEVPMGPHDWRLPVVATEAGVIRCGTGA
ncbi:5-formyltetrahydrofolate cyclo-ligase [Plastoroseomonas arctica]|uniref:5-formyltetrahydrofolate cyclo-ligase n=1 Tax=Plastoroseomonas arctica TaxID=1509237 RepID=A0AAF1JXG2_9PROT|nr:5-formyltetrahydrofolate cyclo-ligase [Plastoroseomonas arctica]MBR0655667.1 5-formyltetrahydrofolate cyclo-ligase [Plastoroseomonas arctica]